ncbi:hypothetical protein ACFPN1_16120 [Lysobacter yangpyeongensis]|uniref:Uncharacterized protein n=1 Tax=Lysobacter yangpyeongensis TaxID=346182 RepID=A0ABW0SR84_9GAMM
MQIPADQMDEASLTALGAEAVQLLCTGDTSGLINRFGYALALGREPAAAVQHDLALCLAELQASKLVRVTGKAPAKVRYFEPSDSGLLAVVEALAPTDNGAAVLVELIVSASGQSKHVTLEQLSAAA